MGGLGEVNLSGDEDHYGILDFCPQMRYCTRGVIIIFFLKIYVNTLCFLILTHVLRSFSIYASIIRSTVLLNAFLSILRSTS